MNTSCNCELGLCKLLQFVISYFINIYFFHSKIHLISVKIPICPISSKWPHSFLWYRPRLGRPCPGDRWWPLLKIRNCYDPTPWGWVIRVFTMFYREKLDTSPYRDGKNTYSSCMYDCLIHKSKIKAAPRLDSLQPWHSVSGGVS